jgi:hypothetical protein
MNRAIALWSAAFAMTGLSLGAQAPTPQAPPTNPAPAQTVVPAEATSFTGCLRAWSDGAAEPAATPSESRAASTARFTLTQIERTVSQVAASTDSASKTEELRLLLVPTGAMDLAAHVNTKVTVTGTLAAAADETRAVGTSGRQAGSGADTKLRKPQEAHPYQNMTVTSVAPSAKSCDK